MSEYHSLNPYPSQGWERFLVCFDFDNYAYRLLWLRATFEWSKHHIRNLRKSSVFDVRRHTIESCWTADVKGANIDQVITNFVDIDLQTKMLHFTWVETNDVWFAYEVHLNIKKYRKSLLRWLCYLTQVSNTKLQRRRHMIHIYIYTHKESFHSTMPTPSSLGNSNDNSYGWSDFKFLVVG